MQLNKSQENIKFGEGHKSDEEGSYRDKVVVNSSLNYNYTKE